MGRRRRRAAEWDDGEADDDGADAEAGGKPIVEFIDVSRSEILLEEELNGVGDRAGRGRQGMETNLSLRQ